MKAWLLNGYDGVDAMELRDDVPDPIAEPGRVVVRVRLAALNPADRYLAQKLYPARPTFPHILGRDGMGEIAAVGPGVTGVSVGSPVAILRGDAGVDERGTLAELVSLPAARVVPVPVGWTPEQAAGVSLVYQTAHQALRQWGEPGRGTWVLVTGASGGVGLATLHLAKAWGLNTIALSRGESKAAALRDQGADAVFDPTDPDLRTHLKKATGGAGVDLLVDNVGGELLGRLIDSMGMWGRVSVVGMLAGAVPQFNTAKLFFRRLRIGGVSVSTYDECESRGAWNEVVSILNASGRRPVVDSVWPMADVKAAFARLAEGPLGKVLVRVAD